MATQSSPQLQNIEPPNACTRRRGLPTFSFVTGVCTCRVFCIVNDLPTSAAGLEDQALHRGDGTQLAGRGNTGVYHQGAEAMGTTTYQHAVPGGG